MHASVWLQCALLVRTRPVSRCVCCPMWVMLERWDTAVLVREDTGSVTTLSIAQVWHFLQFTAWLYWDQIGNVLRGYMYMLKRVKLSFFHLKSFHIMVWCLHVHSLNVYEVRNKVSIHLLKSYGKELWTIYHELNTGCGKYKYTHAHMQWRIACRFSIVSMMSIGISLG